MFRLLASLVFLLLSTNMLAAQAYAGLIADSITYDADSADLRASGNVVVSYEGVALEAVSISYNSATGQLRAEGPLRLTTADGTVTLADLAELSSDLQTGLISGARVLLADQFQLAAPEIRRTGGRFTAFYQVVGSSCQVCGKRPTPIWQIRASRVIHDQEVGRFYFENATFVVFGLPILQMPRMSIPDPSITRSSGFLFPELAVSNSFGNGIKMPYYLVLGDHSDATFTPFVTTNGAFVIEAEYRKRLINGSIDILGAFALTDPVGGTGGFLKASVSFGFGDRYEAFADFNFSSTNGFLRRFDYDESDRLVSEIGLRRYGDSGFLNASLVYFQSLREGELASEIPIVLPEVTWRRTFVEPLTGGSTAFTLETVGLWRSGGRDMLRASASGDWRRDWSAPFGMRLTTFAETHLDLYRVWDDGAYSDNVLKVFTPIIGAELRWPLSMTRGEVLHMLEPVAQFIYTVPFGFNDDVPNEDSTQLEFDETNLFAVNRFPGANVYEAGFRANLGASYRRFDPDGWIFGFDAGRVYRFKDNGQFTTESGLGGAVSDVLAAVRFELPPHVRVINRFLIGGGFNVKRAEVELSLDYDRFNIESSYVYLAPNVSADAPDARSEIQLAADWRMSQNWKIGAEWRHDLIAQEPVYGALGLTYGNECIEVEVSVARRFTDSANFPAGTTYNIAIKLAGLGATLQTEQPAQRCMRSY